MKRPNDGGMQRPLTAEPCGRSSTYVTVTPARMARIDVGRCNCIFSPRFDFGIATGHVREPAHSVT